MEKEQKKLNINKKEDCEKDISDKDFEHLVELQSSVRLPEIPDYV